MPNEKDIDEPVSDKKSSKASASSSNQKSKDLSHVPCKFFKVGSCTAGASCPFSHNVEPGAPKDVCAWFIKGNCKFGHKCALAHILPGQPMSMDRKNKKAAQLANNANNPSSSGSPRDREKSKTGKKDGRPDGTRANTAANSLLGGGSTAPTRLLARGPPALSKASLSSPSAPAPPITVKGTEFVQALGDDVSQHDDRHKNRKENGNNDHSTPLSEPRQLESTPKPLPPSNPKPVSSGPPPQSTHPRSQDHHASPFMHSVAQSSTSPSRPNGFSPGTSPSSHNPLGNGVLSASSFSIPTQAVFISSTYAGEAGLLSSRAGAPSSSLGAGKWGETGAMSAGQQGYTSINAEYDAYSNRNIVMADRSTGEDDTGAEDFVPSSLTDLLTPEEKKRRMTKGTTPTKGSMTRGSEGEDSLRVGLNLPAGGQGGGGGGHRYSRSVPSPSFLGDIRNIWAEPNVSSSPSGFAASGLPASPGRLTNGFTPISSAGPPDSAGLSSAGTSTSFSHHLSPSNASAAFLSSGLHQQYAKSRQGNNNVVGRNVFSGQHRPAGLDFSNAFPNSPPSHHNLTQGIQTSSAELFPTHRVGGGGVGGGSGTTANTSTTNALYTNRHNNANNTNELANMGIGESGILSPGSRALQNHAPGQSLPQGLAAGYSRIHALPPPLPLNSPSASRGLASTGTGNLVPPGSSPLSSSFSGGGDWGSSTREGGAGGPGTTPTKGAGLDQMLSKVSYSHAARASPSAVSPFTPPQVSRSASGRGPGTVGSPLAAQTAGGGGASGDDDLFSMDDS